MDIKKQANSNIRVILSDTELIDAIEEKFKNVYEAVTETACIQVVKLVFGGVEIVIGDIPE